MRTLGIDGGELRGQPANPDSSGKWPLNWRVQLSNFCIISLTNKQTNADENITTSVDVIALLSNHQNEVEQK